MRKLVKICLFFGILITIVGSVFVGIGIATKAFEVKYEEKTYNIKNTFENINIDVETADIIIKPSTDGNSKVDYVDFEKIKYNVSDNTSELKITSNTSELKWYEHITLFGNYKNNKIVITLAFNTFKKFNIKTSTGDIKIEKGFTCEEANIIASTGDILFDSNIKNKVNIVASTGAISLNNAELSDNIVIKTSTGSVNLSNVKANNIVVTTDTGDVKFKNVIIKDNISVTASTGDITLTDSDANTLTLKSSTGDITGSLLSPKKFIAHTSTGDIDVPNTDGGECKITTSTGDIIFTVKK